MVAEPTLAEAWTLSVAADFTGVGDDRSWHVRGRIESAPGRVFRDGSTGYLVHFVDLEQADSPNGPWLRAGLDGRSVEMRRFEGGEILDLAQLHHLSGAPRHGDVLDVVFPGLVPSPPSMGAGDTAYRRTAWPFVLRKGVGWRQGLLATWTNLGVEGVGEGRTARLSYEGKLEGTGDDDRHEQRFLITGTASGEVEIEVATGRLLRHELDWTRQVAVTSPTGSVDQEQHFRITLETTEPSSRAAPTPRTDRDDRPFGNYMEPQDVHDALVPQIGVFESCYSHSGAAGRTEVGEVFVDFTIAPDGSVRDGIVRDSRSEFPELDACLAGTTASLKFPGHDEEPLRVGYPLVWRESALQAYPMVFVEDRPVGELLVMH